MQAYCACFAIVPKASASGLNRMRGGRSSHVRPLLVTVPGGLHAEGYIHALVYVLLATSLFVMPSFTAMALMVVVAVRVILFVES